MSSQANRALFATQDAEFVVRDDVRPQPGDGELLIQNIYSGVNPADFKHAVHLGIRSTVIGYDFCGRVLSASAASQFSEGDVVAGYTPSGMGRQSKYGTHQDLLVCPENMAFKVPAHLPQSHAAALAVVAMTAADVVFNLWGLPLPTKPVESARPVLIWGASSSVGICALQFARASGCRDIIVTASPGRHELLKSLGATHVFDYSSPTVVEDIAAAVDKLGHGPISYTLDAVGKLSEPASASMVAQCVTDPTAVFSSVVIQQDQRFRMPVAMTKDDWQIHPPGAPAPISIPARPASHWNAWEALLWAVENYGTLFKLPSVEVFQGTAEAALQEIGKVVRGERGFGKLVIAHPLK
ncbi:hypothetical protein VUR80DRAFT_7887 [Thermomyces stellatus]